MILSLSTEFVNGVGFWRKKHLYFFLKCITCLQSCALLKVTISRKGHFLQSFVTFLCQDARVLDTP